PPDLLIADVDLGRGMNGLELADKAKRAFPRMRILIMSGLLTAQEFDARGSTDYMFLEKPFSFPVLRETLQTGFSEAPRENALS
ncbi:MAG: hypothetical protein ACK5JT_09955, partial [Hyphomicrobiaceae bacterium]